MSASIHWMPWKLEIGCPNWWRSLVLERVIESPFRDAQRLRTDAGTGSVEHRERDLEARALIAESVRDRNLDVLEDKLRGGRTADAELVLELGRLPRALLAFQHERRDAVMIGFGTGLREHHECARHAPAGDELLRAVEDVLIAVPRRAGLHGGGIGTGAGLRESVSRDLLT